MAYRQSIGQAGENEAVDFLLKKGFAVIERNVRIGKGGEIDIVASKEQLIVFVEVKKRSNRTYGGALYAISEKKKHTLRKTAQMYLINRNLLTKTLMFRFDLIAIENGEVKWIQDIIR